MRIETFEIRKDLYGYEVVLYPTVIEINGKIYLIDCGYEETFEEFTIGLRNLNIEIQDLHAILISHDDIDHIGALSLFKSNNPNIIIYCSYIEEQSITGKIKSERLEQAENSLFTLPENDRKWANQFIQELKKIKRIGVDRVLEDCEWIDEKIQVIFTPGHTKGHISFFLPSDKILIANDAIVIEENTLDIANPSFVLDKYNAIKSVIRIKELLPNKMICYHGGVIEDNLTEKLNELINKYKDFLL